MCQCYYHYWTLLLHTYIRRKYNIMLPPYFSLNTLVFNICILSLSGILEIDYFKDGNFSWREYQTHKNSELHKIKHVSNKVNYCVNRRHPITSSSPVRGAWADGRHGAVRTLTEGPQVRSHIKEILR